MGGDPASVCSYYPVVVPDGSGGNNGGITGGNAIDVEEKCEMKTSDCQMETICLPSPEPRKLGDMSEC